MVLFDVFYALVIVNLILASFNENRISKQVNEKDVEEYDESFGLEGKTPLVSL
jgi:hypothetical protein